MSVDILKEDIKNNKLKSLYLFYGAEEYLKKYYIESIEKSVLTGDLRDLNRIVLEGKPEVRKIIEASETMPVFSEKKVVIVKNSGLFKAKAKSGDEKTKGKGHGDELLDYLQNVPTYTCLIFCETEIDKRVKVVDAVKKGGLIVEFAMQKPAELVKWVAKVFKSNKKDIDPMTASLLVDYSEQGMNEILNEINKVVLYMGDRVKVSSDDIKKVCTKSIKSRIFDLTDAISEGDRAKALRLLDDMVALKEPLPRILFMIARQFRQILEMKLLKGSGVSQEEVAKRMGITPYAASKISGYAGKFSIDRLKDAIKESLEVDIFIKTGKMNDRIAAEMLITKFSKG